MKRIILFFIILLSVFTLVGCAEEKDDTNEYFSRGFFKPTGLSIKGNLHELIGKSYMGIKITGFEVEIRKSKNNTPITFNQSNTFFLEVLSPFSLTYVKEFDEEKVIKKTFKGEIIKFHINLEGYRHIKIRVYEK